jgi:hypothetical protein
MNIPLRLIEASNRLRQIDPVAILHRVASWITRPRHLACEPALASATILKVEQHFGDDE